MSFVDDSSLFSGVNGVNQTHNKLCNDLQVLTMWAYQWKIIFNPDITKQEIEIIFSCKNQKSGHPELNFNGIPVSRETFTKHLGVFR